MEAIVKESAERVLVNRGLHRRHRAPAGEMLPWVNPRRFIPTEVAGLQSEGFGALNAFVAAQHGGDTLPSTDRIGRLRRLDLPDLIQPARKRPLDIESVGQH